MGGGFCDGEIITASYNRCLGKNVNGLEIAFKNTGQYMGGNIYSPY